MATANPSWGKRVGRRGTVPRNPTRSSPDSSRAPSTSRISMGYRRGRGLLSVFLLLDGQEPNDRLGPQGEDARGQPAIEHEGPVKWRGEDLLEDPQAVGPLVEGHLHHLVDGGRGQEGEGPRACCVGPVDPE